MPGIGIALSRLEGKGNLKVKVGDNPKTWTISKNRARKFIERHRSYYDARGTKLGVVAWQEFKAEPI
jgi:hypothetical protein